MVTGLRVFVVAAMAAASFSMDVIAASGPASGPDEIIPASMIAFREAGESKYNMKFYRDRWEKSDPRYCADSGSDCRWVEISGDPSLQQPTNGFIKRVPGGYLVTAPMASLAAELYDGQDLGTVDPVPGTIVGRKQYAVRIIAASGEEGLNNVVVDFSGCVVDSDLNVTKFVPAR